MSDSAPSKVVHFGNVASDVTKQDFIFLTQPWGSISHVLLLKHNQALVQFNDLAAAVNFVQYHKNFSIQLKGKAMYTRFSTHQTLSKGLVDQDPSATAAATTTGGPPPLEEKRGRVLLVSILNQHFIITVDSLHGIFSKFGFIEKIVLFSKTAGLQALVQFRSEHDAAAAKHALNGTSPYPPYQPPFMDACCTFSIRYSNLSDITVHQNTDRSRDYTNPTLPEQMSVPLMTAGPFPTATPTYAPYAAPMFQHIPRGLEPDKCVLLVSNLNVERMDCDKIFNLFSCYGHVSKVKIFQKKRDNALVQMADGQQAAAAITNLKGLEIFGTRLGVNYSKHAFITSTASIHSTAATSATASSTVSAAATAGTTTNATGSTSNGSSDASSPAASAPSANTTAATSIDLLTKDYTKTSLNRYSNRQMGRSGGLGSLGGGGIGGKMKTMCPPSNVLHVSNLGSSLSESALEELFGRFSGLKAVKAFDHGEKRMGLVRFASVSSAAEALVTLHNSIYGGRQIRISFSMNNMI